MNYLIERLRSVVRSLLEGFAGFVNNASRGKITPNQITIVGFLAHFFVAWQISLGNHILAGGLLILFGLFDTLDGALARLQKTASKKGMLLDSITDRLKEVILYAGIASFMVTTGRYQFAVWAVLACGTSIVVSYINAWGEVVTKSTDNNHKTNKQFRLGIMSYDVRMFTLVIGLFSGKIEAVLIIITVLSCWTAFERYYNITKIL